MDEHSARAAEVRSPSGREPRLALLDATPRAAGQRRAGACHTPVQRRAGTNGMPTARRDRRRDASEHDCYQARREPENR
jgi:hypothetical protein